MLGQELWVSCGYVVGTEGLVVRLSRQQQTAFGAGAQPPAPQVGSHVHIVKRKKILLTNGMYFILLSQDLGFPKPRSSRIPIW